jgi:hypothetical protein
MHLFTLIAAVELLSFRTRRNQKHDSISKENKTDLALFVEVRDVGLELLILSVVLRHKNHDTKAVNDENQVTYPSRCRRSMLCIVVRCVMFRLCS